MNNLSLSFQCPFPISQYPIITLAHGGGGKLTQRLIQDIFIPAFNNPELNSQHDGAHIRLNKLDMVITTDSYVLTPLEVPGCNIGKLAITGTVNDLSMCGAKPRYLSCAFILTEGLETAVLIKTVDAMRLAALEAGILLVTGDTKVVERTNPPGLYINTTGIGELISKPIGASLIQAGDAIIVSGDIGRHGMAVLAAREKLQFEPAIESDCAILAPVVEALISANLAPHCLRDLTRGGLSGGLIELAQACNLTFEIKGSSIPISENVFSACELLGLDALYVANEGTMVLIVAEAEAEAVLAILHSFEITNKAAIIGQVKSIPQSQGEVHLKNALNSSRRLHHFSGEQLPRIC